MRSREEKLEFKKELEARTLDFSVRVFKLLNALPKNSAMRVISYQLGKSASSIGANYREANRAESGDDFPDYQSNCSLNAKVIRTFKHSEHSNISPW